MALFLAKLCEEHPTYLHLLLFDESLLCDIRILLINELIGKKFYTKFKSIDHVNEVFHLVEVIQIAFVYIKIKILIFL